MNTIYKVFCISILLHSVGSAMELNPSQLGKQLLEAAETGDYKAAEHLIQAGADINYQAKGITPLKAAAGALIRDEGVFNPWLEITRLLIAAKADINHRSVCDDRTPLAHAAEMRNFNIAFLLIEAGADVAVQSCSFQRTTLLQYATSNKNYGLLNIQIPNLDERSLSICVEVVEKLLQIPDAYQHKRLVTFLCCLRKSFGKNVTQLFKAWLPRIIAQENREHFNGSYAHGQIVNLRPTKIQSQLLEKYLAKELKLEKEQELLLEQSLARDPDLRLCPTRWCKFRYSVEAPGIVDRVWNYLFGGPTFACPECESTIFIHQSRKIKP